MVRPDYPRFEQFRCLTSQEEAHDLLSAPNIGFRDSWNALLEKLGIEIVDRHLCVADGQNALRTT